MIRMEVLVKNTTDSLVLKLCTNTLPVFKHPILRIPPIIIIMVQHVIACTSEQGNVIIGLVSMYIYIYIFVYT